MKTCKLLIIACLLILIAGCTNASWKNMTTLGCDFKIELYSGGTCVKEWTSDGKVQTENQSDGWLFKDKKTGKLIRVSGEVVITEL